MTILYFIIIFLLLIVLFLVFNSVIWLKNKKITDINDKIIEYIIYLNFIVISCVLIFISYLYFNNYYLTII
jgi:hypothetical protein